MRKEGSDLFIPQCSNDHQSIRYEYQLQEYHQSDFWILSISRLYHPIFFFALPHQIDEWIEETISGTKSYNKRELGKLLKKVQEGDLIICAELSRLGRNLFMIMEILNICMTKECRVWTIKDNYRLGDDIQSKVLAFAFGLSAEIERNLISQRTKEALARKKAEGQHIGRIKGSKNNQYKLTGKEQYIKRSLENGRTIKYIAKRLNVHRSTVSRFIEQSIAPQNVASI